MRYVKNSKGETIILTIGFGWQPAAATVARSDGVSKYVEPAVNDFDKVKKVNQTQNKQNQNWNNWNGWNNWNNWDEEPEKEEKPLPPPTEEDKWLELRIPEVNLSAINEYRAACAHLHARMFHPRAGNYPMTKTQMKMGADGSRYHETVEHD